MTWEGRSARLKAIKTWAVVGTGEARCAVVGKFHGKVRVLLPERLLAPEAVSESAIRNALEGETWCVSAAAYVRHCADLTATRSFSFLRLCMENVRAAVADPVYDLNATDRESIKRW